MLKFITSIFSGKNTAIIKKFQTVINQINHLESEISKLSNEELKQKTAYFQNKLDQKATLESIMPEAFAVVREAAKRTLNQRPFDVQLMGGLALHSGAIAEMSTGEGKTLVSTMPAYLNALSKKGVHIVTVNDYLAKRDSEWMGKVYNFLGLSVGAILSKTSDEERKIAYNSDITYATNNELGFDYLRDNMKYDMQNMSQRQLNYAIIDEVDSILIDEARTPLIISGPASDKTHFYKLTSSFVNKVSSKDFEIDEKNKNIHLTEEGLTKFEDLLKKSGLELKGGVFDSQNIELYHFFMQSLKASHLYKKDVDYIIKDKEVVIIDEFTGRMMEGRRYSEGLHQAIEAKENLPIRSENQTLASITFQNYFKLYNKISGMTGTAKTEANEFLEIYSLEVISIPTNKKLLRKDKADKIYISLKEKENAILEKVKNCFAHKQPVLIGTTSIERSEKFSSLLKSANIPHNVLNAKFHDKEAEIISQAGKSGAITIATNMAGRGTDIKLGGNLDLSIEEATKNLNTKEEITEEINTLTKLHEKEKAKIMELGGLVIIGTERHESRRIDNQLRGRAGRQGEAGETTFYLSLEDDLMRVFGSNKLESMLQKIGFKENEVITHPLITKAIERAQKKVEEYNFEIRKSLLKFDNVINEQRKVIYEQRKEILTSTLDIKNLLINIIEEVTTKTIQLYLPENDYREKWDIINFNLELHKLLNLSLNCQDILITQRKPLNFLKDEIITLATSNLNNKIDLIENTISTINKIPKDETHNEFNKLIKNIILQSIDMNWKQHLLELDYIRSSINLRSFANKDPLHEYQQEAFVLFQGMLEELNSNIITVVSHLTINTTPPKK